MSAISRLYPVIPYDEHAGIAAIANNMILVTRNTDDFDGIPGLMCENWFD